MATLSAAERTHYLREGYVIPSFRLSERWVNRLGQALDVLIRANPHIRPEKLVSAHLENGTEGTVGVKTFLDLAMDADILDLVEAVLGPDVILWGCQVFCKPGGDGMETPWHQDGHYWPIRPLATCTVWVAIEPSTRANGCLRVIPRSHADRRLHAHLYEDRTDLVLNQRIAQEAFDPVDAVDLELQPGEMSLHDVYMIHGADANRSGQRRTGVALRYMPGSSVFDRALQPVQGRSGLPVDFSRRPLWLLRGADRTGQNDFSIGHAPAPAR